MKKRLLLNFSLLICSLLIASGLQSQGIPMFTDLEGNEIHLQTNEQEIFISFNSDVNLDAAQQLADERPLLSLSGETPLFRPMNGALYSFAGTASQLNEELATLRTYPQIASAYPGYILNGDPTYIHCTLILNPKSAYSSNALQNDLTDMGLTLKENFDLGQNEKMVVVTVPVDQNLWDVSQELHADYKVSFAHPDFIGFASHEAIPNDPFFGSQWFLNQPNDADIDGPEAWDCTTGSPDVVVAVIDGNGYDLGHPEFAGQIVAPYNAVADNNNPSPENGSANHGTPCAGLVAGLTNNSVGVASVGFNIKVKPVVIGFNAAGNSFSTSQAIVLAAISDVIATPGVVAVSNSYGGGLFNSNPAVITGFETMRNNCRGGLGAVILASSGNSGSGTFIGSPGAYTSTLAVGASDQADTRANFSQYGTFGNGLDLVAPGVSTLTLDRQGAPGYNGGPTNDYVFFSGTSAACPIAAAVVGLIASANPGQSELVYENILTSTCDKVRPDLYTYGVQTGKPNGTWNNEMGYGRVNAFAAVKAVVDAYCPDPPFVWDAMICEGDDTSAPLTALCRPAIDPGGDDDDDDDDDDDGLGDCTDPAGNGNADLCANALPAFNGLNCFDNTQALTDGAPDPLCVAFGEDNINSDVWFVYNATDDGLTRVNTCGLTALDTKLAVYDGSCAGPIIDCNDDFCGLQSEISFNAIAGNDYIIRVGSFSPVTTGTGRFQIIPPPDMDPPSDDPADNLACDTDEVINWYEEPYGGESIFTGPEFDPVAEGVIMADAVGVYKFYASCTCGDCESRRTEAIFEVKENPTVFLSSNGAELSPLCIGEDLFLHAEGGIKYSWTGPNNFSANDDDPIIFNALPANAGIYTVEVGGANGCVSTETLEVFIEDRPFTIECPANLVLNLNSSCDSPLASIPDYRGQVLLEENCHNDFTILQSPAPGSPLVGGPGDVIVITITVVNNLTDGEDVCTSEIILVDNQDPHIYCPDDQKVAMDDMCMAVLPDYTGDALAFDNCQVFGCEFEMGFTGAFDAALWTKNLPENNGTSMITINPLALTIETAFVNSAVTSATVFVPCDGQIFFNWDYIDFVEGIGLFGYSINGAPFVLAGPVSGSGGVEVVDVVAGDVFGFFIDSQLGTDTGGLSVSMDFMFAPAAEEGSCELTITQDPAPGTILDLDIPVDVTLTVTDCSNNSNSCTFTVTGQDCTAPVIVEAPCDVTVECGPDNDTELQTWLDNHGGFALQTGCVLPNGGGGDSDEGEACGEDINGGSNAPAGCPLGSLTPGTVLSGISFADGGFRDTDWYLLDFEGTCEVDITLTADFDAILFKVDNACAGAVVIGSGPYGSAAGVPYTITVNVNEFSDCTEAVIFVAPGFPNGGGIFEGIPCGTNNNYTLEVSLGTGSCACAPLPVRMASAQEENDQKSDPRLFAQNIDGEIRNTKRLADGLGACAVDNCTVEEELVWTYELLYIDDHCFNTETRVYEFTVTDAAGNSATARGSFTTEDTTAPVFDTPLPPTEYSGANFQCQENVPPVPTVTATDACGNVIIDFSETVAPGTCEDKFVVTRTWVAYDNCGNTDVFVQDITINDDTPPVIEGGADITIDCDQANANNDDQLLSWLVNNGGATATDNCSPVVWSNDYDVANFEAGCNNTRGIEVVFTATDVCGNMDDITLSYTVIDTIPPVFENCPRPDVVENAEKDHCDAYVNFGPPIAFDNCSDVTISNLSPYKPDESGERYESGDRFPIGTTIMTYEAEDACGNTTICKIKVIVNNFWEVPEIECVDDITMNNETWECSAPIVVPDPDVTVLCPELAMTTYQIEHDGEILETGLVDPAGPPAVNFEFPVGTSTVTYCVQDQPLLLISEVSQDIDNVCGGAPLAFDLPDDVTANDCIEITNFGGVDYDLSCLVIERCFGDLTETFVVPEDTTVEPGGTLTLCYGTIAPSVGCGDDVDIECIICDELPQVEDIVFAESGVDENGNEFASILGPKGGPSIYLNYANSDGFCVQDAWQLRLGKCLSIKCDPCDLTTELSEQEALACLPVLQQLVMEWEMSQGALQISPTVFLHETTVNLDPGDEAWYKVYYNENFIDDVTMSSDAQGGIIREAVKDTDDPADFILADVCTPISIGKYNPDYPDAVVALNEEGEESDLVASLQSVEAKMASCSVDVTVIDNEGPMCQMIDGSVENDDVFVVLPNECNEFSLILGDCLAQDVTVSLSGDLFPVISMDLYAPSGDVIPLLANDIFSGLTVTLMDQLYSAKLGGEWTLEVVTDKEWSGPPVTEIIFEIEATCLVDWEAPDDATVNLDNDLGLCSAEYSWTHPWAVDNCRDVTISVAYEFTPFNDLGPDPTVPADLTLEGYGGQDATETFSVGTTTVTYTLIDQFGNESECGFEIVVTDAEDPVITYCYPEGIDVFLDPGECRRNVTYEIEATDNCGVLSKMGYPPSGAEFEIGWTPVDVTVTDIHGNTATCSFDVHVHEFEPESDELACNNQIQLSLDGECKAELTADMILEGDIYRCYENYCMEIYDEDDNLIFPVDITLAPPITLGDAFFTFTKEHANQNFRVKIIDCLGGGNSCWGYVLVEEKIEPDITCPQDVTVFCGESVDPSYTGSPVLNSCEPFATGFTYEDDVQTNGQCDDPRSVITRTWFFDDNQGNVVECPQIIRVKPIDIREIDAPADIEVADAFECGDLADDPALLHPNNTGYPMFNGNELPAINSCNLGYNYWDKHITSCPGNYLIIRTWEIADICLPQGDNNPSIKTQFIKVFDTEGPELHECPDDLTISTDPWTCAASSELPIPEVLYDKCSDMSFEASIFGGGNIIITQDETTGEITSIYANNMVRGPHTVRYTATDECGNVTNCDFDILVIDEAPPVAIALQNIVISLTSSSTDGNGVAKLYVEDVDNGSFDSCSDDLYYELRRADGATTDCTFDNGSCDARGNNTFSDRDVFGEHPYCRFDTEDGGQYVKFCCADIDADLGYGLVDVIMRVWDDSDLNGTPGDIGSDNYNDTWATIRVEDKLPIQIQCPDDVTIDCFEDPEDTRLTGVATGTGTCAGLEATPEYDYSNVDQCGGPDGNALRDGYVIITWTVTSNGRTAECEQIVRIVAKDPFNYHDITWPGDIETDCRTPEAGEPSWNEVPCSLVGSSMEQQVFEFEEDACYKELNHWTIIDWCAYDPLDYPTPEDDDYHELFDGTYHYELGSPRGIWTHTQVVKVIDTSKPVLECVDQPEWATEDCLAQNVELTNSATDEGSNCPSPWLKWEVCLDINYDWVCDHIWTSDEGMATQSRTDIYYYVAPSGPGEEITLPVGGSSNEPDELDLPIGTHRVLWTVNDGCGNVSACTQFINVTDGKAPTPYCIQNLSTAVMDHGGTVTIWASDFNLASTDNCTTDPDDLLYSFSGTSYVPSREFECDELEGEAFKIFDLEMWVWDEAGNADFCFVQLRINDNGVCGGEGRATVAGSVQTRLGDMVENTQVSINSVLPEFPISQVTEEDGNYAFEQIPMYNNYDLTALRNDDHGNGVSTLDMVIIIRHVIGLESLDDPYRSIAADVNSDNKISSLDLIQMRRLILGIADEFPQNDSWRFVDAVQSFDDANNPWPFTEIVDLPLISADMMAQDFVGVKIGDVSGDAEANSFMSTEVRTNASLKLETDEQLVQTGDIITVPISSEEFDNVYGYQFTFNVDGLSYQGVEPGVLDISEDNFGLHRVNEGLISTTWSSSEAVTTDDVLFTLVFKAETDDQLSKLFSIGSEITKAEAYRSSALSIEGVEIGFRTDNGLLDANPFALYQNQPNPFSDVTQIGFVLPESGEATMTIYDVTGKVVKIVEGDYSKGYNEVSLKRQDLGMAGMLYYQLDAGDHTATKKMIIVK